MRGLGTKVVELGDERRRALKTVSGGHRSRSGAVLRTGTGSVLRTAMWLSARYQSCSGEVKRLRRVAAEAASRPRRQRGQIRLLAP